MRIDCCDHGIPFDVSFSAPDYWILAAYVVNGQREGGRWLWNEMNWEPKR